MKKTAAFLLFSLATAAPASAGPFSPTDHAGKNHLEAMKQFAAGRKGFVVWESRRPTGTKARKYRIWKRNLDGTGLAMISGMPGADNYAHFAPRISPDGRHVIFAGKEWNSTFDENTRTLFNGEYAAPPFDAWIVGIHPRTLEAGEPREIKALHGRVGGAGEDHVFEWRDNRTVHVNLPDEGGIYAFDIASEKIGRELVHCGRNNLILSPGGKYVICAQGGGAGYRKVEAREGETPTVNGVNKLGGCQVSISSRGDWLVWMEKASQLSALNLKTGKRHDLGEVKRRLPRGHNYIYFPALSRDMTLLAIGGSDMHSHAYGDYEIFLFPWDPETCRPSGNPVRYSFNDRGRYPGVDKKGGHALDRWPDVWVYNPEFSGEGDGGEAEETYPKLTLEVLDTNTRVLEEKSLLDQAVRRLAQLAADRSRPDRAGKARRELEALQEWAELVLKDARDKEKTAPGEAVRLYKWIAGAFRERSPGKRAGKRFAELRDDPEFRKEAEAWGGYVTIRDLAKDFKWPSGAKQSANDQAFARANAHAISRIRSIFQRLQAGYPSTRATLEARSLIHRYDIHVELPVPADQKVAAIVDAVVVRTSTPLKAADIAPYTEALMTIEYRAEEVLSGKLDSKRFVAVHLVMQEGKLLPPGRLEKGTKVRLKLGLWSTQNNYMSHPIADGIEDRDANYYFVFAGKVMG
ncbi:MAG: hypothetical protein R6V03_02200 [Kiritimatiellia bacterium]